MGVTKAPLRIEEQDGSPSVIPVKKIKVTNEDLTDDGSGVVSLATASDAASGGGPPQAIFSTIFEDVTNTRFQSYTSGSGSVATSIYGADVITGATANSYAAFKINGNFSAKFFTGSSSIAVRFFRDFNGTDSSFYAGVGTITYDGTNEITCTGRNYGFKVNRVSSSDTLEGVNGNGSSATETTLTGFSASTNQTYCAVKDGTSSIKFYVNQSLEATHTTNIPADAGSNAMGHFALNNKNTASNVKYKIVSYSLQNDMY